jgi:hypothetical protein
MKKRASSQLTKGFILARILNRKRWETTTQTLERHAVSGNIKDMMKKHRSQEKFIGLKLGEQSTH